MSRRRRVAVLGCIAFITAGAGTLEMQRAELFKGRLSRLPVDRSTAPTVAGQGTVSASLEGNELILTATFQGMSSPATATHIHRAPLARRGPVVFTVEFPAVTAGEIKDTIILTDSQVEQLRDGFYYLQVHTEGNPAGELRGWLLLQ